MDLKQGAMGGMLAQDIEQLKAIMGAPVSVSYSPVNGATINLDAIPNDMFVSLTPATDLDSLTLVVPPESVGRENQALRIRSTRNIASLVIAGAATIDNAEVMLSANGVTVFFKFAPNTWSRTV